MTEPIRRIKRCWHDHGGGVSFFMARHDEGSGPIYRLEGIESAGNGVVQKLLSWGSEEKAKGIAKNLLDDAGHQCGDTCRDWETVSN